LMRKLTLAALAALTTVADNWPAWRGLDGSGVCRETNLPLRWSTNENVRWRVPLPDRGNSTPIVWRDRVFVTQAIEKENRRTLMCFDRRDGKLLWQHGPIWTEKEMTHSDNPPCTPSPVTDGQRIIAWFGSAGVYCFDLDGRELWRRDLGPQKHEWGYASSPVPYRDLCFLNFGAGRRSFIIALDKKTGATAWQRHAPDIGANATWADLSNQGVKPPGEPLPDYAGSWATPLMVPAAGGDELVVAFALRLMAFAPTTGEPLWTCGGPDVGAYSSPFFGQGIIALNASGHTNTMIAVRPGGGGDVTKTHRAWFQKIGDSKPCLGAGVIHRGHIYQANAMGFLECRALATGQLLWEERLTGTGARNASWSAPVLAGDRLYVANRNADIFVLRASPKFECVATNSIGGEPMNASLAISDGNIFIRTDKQLWCIGNE
jgi:outer membrane protein assembly factor BamB